MSWKTRKNRNRSRLKEIKETQRSQNSRYWTQRKKHATEGPGLPRGLRGRRIRLSMQETQIWSLGWEDPLEKEGKGDPLQYSGWENSLGSQRIGHDWVTELNWWLSNKESACQCRRHRFDPWVRKISWIIKWQPIPGFLPRQSHGQRSLVGYSPRICQRVRHDLVTKQQRYD